MNRKPLLALLLVTCSVALWAESKASKAATNGAPAITYAKDVAPILNKNCVSCHRPGDVAPMALMSYEQVRPWAKSIREKVSEGTMPPWHADPKIGKFANERRLTPKEVATLVAWVDGGMRPGNPKDLPPAPRFDDDGWRLGKPDVVFSLPEEQDVPASGVVDYRHIEVPTKFTEDKWIVAGEIRPSDRAVVHHVIVFVRDPEGSPRLPAGLQLRLPPADPNQPAPQPTAAQQQRRQRGPRGWVLIGSGAGEQVTAFPPGTGKLVRAGSTLIFQMHYTPNGHATKDRTSIALSFAKETPEYELRTVGVSNPRFVIPAGEANYRVDSAAEFTEDAVVFGLFPHMHVRGKSFDYRVVGPDGIAQPILSVPKYDFGWQTNYVFQEPLKVSKGSRLECTAYFDNSTNNRFNPDPTQDVRWGDQTWEEMMIGWMDYSVANQRVVRSASR
jgi:mono/diheme cytochrome c family protein